MLRTIFLMTVLMLAWLTPVVAAINEYEFDNETQEQRFKKLTAEMRCPMCLNSNLAGSDAPIARDLTQEIYEQVMAGRSDEQIEEFMQARYGDFILYRPPLNTGTFLLWFGPLILLLGGFFIARRMMKNSNVQVETGSLSNTEKQ
ncbi:MAG: cytochrome c-type biogenesis protein, partial [Pseudohongiellaceae bacterium]